MLVGLTPVHGSYPLIVDTIEISLQLGDLVLKLCFCLPDQFGFVEGEIGTLSEMP
jgi:hypothetical protein